MTSRMFLFGASLALAVATGAHAHGDDSQVSVKPSFAAALPNVPGKSFKTVVVSYPAGTASTPHSHAKSAFIYAHVLEGAIRSQVDDGPVKVYKAGESWTENPGAHHVISENASKTRPAKLLAVFVVDTDDTALTTPDAH